MAGRRNGVADEGARQNQPAIKPLAAERADGALTIIFVNLADDEREARITELGPSITMSWVHVHRPEYPPCCSPNYRTSA